MATEVSAQPQSPSTPAIPGGTMVESPAESLRASGNIDKISSSHQGSIPLAQISLSKTNPRKAFEGPEFDELVASVKQHGVLQPVLVRWREPIGAVVPTYELVCGERRYRAAKAVGLKEIPCVLRELSDGEALELQIVENLQRKDVTALEESAGFVALFSKLTSDAKQSRVAVVERIAQRVGKTTRYVYARMKLDELAPEVKAAIAAGELTASHGDELVRLPAAQQVKALKEVCFRTEWENGKQNKGEAVSFRELKRRIAEQYFCDLSKAPWKLDQAMPSVLPPGRKEPCSGCKLNSSNDPASSAKNDCLDSACYKAKRLAFVQIAVDATKQKNPGVKEILKLSSEYTGEKDVVRSYDWQGSLVKPGSCASVKTGVVINGDKVGQVKHFCGDYKCKVHHPGTRSLSSPKVDAKALEKQKLELQAKEAGDAAVLAAALAKVKSIGAAELDLVLNAAVNSYDDFGFVGHVTYRTLCVFFGWPVDGDCEAQVAPDRVKKLDAVGKAQVLVALAIDNGYELVGVDTAARLYKLDPKAIRAEAVKKFKAQASGPPPGDSTAGAKSAAAPAGACRVCGCTPQHRCVLKHSTANKGRAQTCKLGAGGVCSNPECEKKAKAAAKTSVKKPAKKAAAKKGGRK